MNNEKDKRLDDLFKKKLDDPVDEPGYREQDWDSLEQMLDKRKKRKGIIFWLPVISSVAAALLLFFGWLNFRPQGNDNHPLAVRPHQHAHTGTTDGATRQPIKPKQEIPTAATYAVNPNTGNNGESRSQKASSAAGTRRTTGPGLEQTSVKSAVTGANTVTETNNVTLARTDGPLLALSATPAFDLAPIQLQPVSSVNLLKNSGTGAVKTAPGKGDKIKIKTSSAFRPQYAITVLAAPDINGVGSFGQSKVGTNIGLNFSAEVLKKFTITTGALYSVKPYNTDIENYHTPYQFPTNPVNITADCRVLDIPLNVGYQVYNKHQNKITIGSGLSSYIMLRESYKFNYASAYATGPASYTVPNSNGYYFGILNLNATFERRLNSKVGLDIQPYLKLPLTNIGYSQVRLQTTGIAVGLHWNLNSLTKP